jgi:hypothetical protein
MKKTKKTRKRITQLKSTAEIPEFISEEEEAKFWDTHSTVELEEKGLLKEVVLKITEPLKSRIEEQRNKQLVSLRLYPSQIDTAKQIAIRKGIGYLTLMRNWIQEGIEKELSKKEDNKRISDLEKQMSFVKDFLIPEKELKENYLFLSPFKSKFPQILDLFSENLLTQENTPPISPSFQNPRFLIVTKRRKTKIGIPSM